MIRDEQIQVALKVWFQDPDYEASKSCMRDMRAVLETLDGPPPPPGTDEHGWYACNWTRQHPVHGTFFVGRLLALGQFSASRVYPDATQESGLGCDSIGREYATFEDAKAAVAQRIAELDAQVAAPAQESEQLEACR